MIKRLLFCTTALWLSLAAPSDVEAAPLVAGITAVFTSLGAAGTAIAGVVFNLAASWIMSLFTPEPKRRGVKERIETGGDNPPAFIVGRYTTAGQLGYVNVHDKPGYNIENACLVYVIILSALPVAGLSTKVIISGETCNIDTSQSFSGFHPVTEYVKGTGGGGYCSVKFKDGTQNSVDPWLLDKFGNHPDYPIDEDMWWKGCAHVIVQCWASNRGIWTGLPEFQWVVDGIPLYDPRKDSSVGGSGPQRWNDKSTWSTNAPRNPKVFAYNAIRGISYGGKKVWGGDAEAYRLPLDYWFAAMNRCDENVTKSNGDVINRFEFSGEIHFDDDPKEILVEVDKGCNGFTTEYAGTYKTWVGEPGLSVATFTDGDIVITEEQEDVPFVAAEETYNTAYGTYTEPREKWGPKDGPRYQDADALAAAGREIAIDVQLPFVTEQNQLQRVLRSIVKDSQRQVTHQMQLPPVAYVLEPYDRVTLISKSRGYNGLGKDFLIASQEDLENCNQRILFREFNVNDLADLSEYADDVSVGPVLNVKPAGVTLDISVFPDQVDSAGGKKDKPAIRAQWIWDGLEIGIRAILYSIRLQGTTKVIARGRISDPEAGLAVIQDAVLRFGKSYEIRFVPELFKSQSDAYTAWLPVTCIIIDVPSTPTLTRVSKLGTDGKLTYFLDAAWTHTTQESTYIVRAIIDGQTLLYPAPRSPARIPASAGSSIVVDVAAVGADGTVGDYSPSWPITITKKNTAPTAPTLLTVNGKIGRVAARTNKNPDGDFDHFNLYGSNSNDFSTATLVDDSRSISLLDGDLGNAVTRYYWITAVDSSGNESTKFPVSNTGGRVATTTRVGAADVDDGAITFAKVDQTAPGVPTIAVVGYGDDFDEDGKMDAGLAITLTHPNTAGTPTGVPIVRYIVKLQRRLVSDGISGTYVDFPKNRYSVDAEDTADTLATVLQIQMNRKYYYKAQVRGIAFGSKKGAFSAYTAAGVRPSTTTGYTGQVVAGPSVQSIANGFVVKGSLGALDPALFREMEILVDGVSLIKVQTLSYSDMTTRAIGAQPTYTIRLYDKAGNASAISGGTIPISPGFRAATSAEVGTLAAANIGNGAVIGSKLVAQDTSNIADNGWASGDLSAWAVQSQQAYYNSTAEGDASGWVLQSIGRDNARSVQIAVNPGETFYFDVWVKQTDVSRAQIMVQAQNPAGAFTFPVVAFTDTKNAWVRLTGQWTVPAGVTRAAMLLQNDRTNGVGTSCYWSRPIMRRVSDSSLIGTGAVGNAALADQAVATAKLADKAVTYNKLYGFSVFNVVPDFELSDPAYWLFEEIVSGAYTPLPSANAVKSGNPTSDNRGYSDFKYRVTSTANNRGTAVTTTPMPVEEGVVYTFSWFIENLRSTDRNINNIMLCYSQDAAGNLVYTGAILAGTKPISAGVALPGSTGVWRYSNVRVPNGVTHIAARTLVSGVAGEINDFYFASPKMQALTPAGDVTRWVNVPTFTYGTFGNSAQRVCTVTLPEYNRSPLMQKAFFAMKNLSGATGRFTIQLQSRPTPFTAAWTNLRSITVNIRDDEYWSTEFFIGADDFESTQPPSTSGLSPDAIQYSILVTPQQAGNNLNQVEMRFETRFA